MDEGSFPRSVLDDRHDSTAERGASRLALDESRGSEALRSVLDASGIGTFIWRIDEDRFEPDERMLALVGLPPGLTFSRDEFIISVIDREDRDRCSDAFADAVHTGSLREEMRVVHADGTVRCLAI